MGWVDDLGGRTVGLDTAPLIYYIEDNLVYAGLLEPLYQAVAAGDIHLVTSTITVVEVLVHPLQRGEQSLAQQYNDFLMNSPHVSTIPVSAAIAQTAAELRATTKLKTPDAIQMATALEYGAAAFLTNDLDFGETSPLQVLRLRDLVE